MEDAGELLHLTYCNDSVEAKALAAGGFMGAFKGEMKRCQGFASNYFRIKNRDKVEGDK